ncbi:MAG: HlyD family secretion protein [Candidatus Accumulibacter phosphatis]|uniref:HlyD family secretion protein n=1 Tax=Candidatus Accumulibacter phosphatis TaxID=327160 RepID=A0A6A7RVR9_9PROT|nr:HlyD family secretion protein [Candidatus Accumulibacter phosphatis]
MNLHSILAAVTLSCFASAALAHGDEDHSQDNKAAAAAPASTPGDGATASGRHATSPQRLPDGSLFVPKPLQRQIGVRSQQVVIGPLSATIELNGQVIADPETGGRVQATFAGSVEAGPKGMPVPGRKVSKGEILAYLRPVSSAIERGNQRAQQAELGGELAIAEARVRRLQALEGAVAHKEIEAARIERSALRKRLAATSASIDGAEPLRAPAAGVISASNLVAGQVVDAKEILFEIIDPTRLAVEALAYQAGIGATLISASALSEQSALELAFVGGGRQMREQALPLLFRIVTPNTLVAVGQPLKVIVRTAHEIEGAAVPRSALTRIGAGETAVWVHSEAERFVARRVHPQALDANTVAISDGLHDGDRVVIEGAGLLSQVR